MFLYNIQYCAFVSVFRLFIWAFLLSVWSLKYPKGVRMKSFTKKVCISSAMVSIIQKFKYLLSKLNSINPNANAKFHKQKL